MISTQQSFFPGKNRALGQSVNLASTGVSFFSNSNKSVKDGDLTLMKEYCKNQQVFFNEGERINFLSKRSKAQYHLYKQSFDASTTKYIYDSVQNK